MENNAFLNTIVGVVTGLVFILITILMAIGNISMSEYTIGIAALGTVSATLANIFSGGFSLSYKSKETSSGSKGTSILSKSRTWDKDKEETPNEKG